ncbi:MAG: S-layer homology domain-containing protein [Clostridia bacterium]|nr:S-layer homology domain-containing protein [Clostridia bacterium]
MPNYDLSVNRSNYGYACSMGNYCVEECYNLKVKNTMPYDRYFEYVAQSDSNVAVYVEDEDGKHSGLFKGEWGDRKDVLASVKIPAKGEKEFKINVILPINCVGGIKNRFMVSDKCSITKTYEDFVKEKNDIEKGVLSYGTSASEVYDKLSDEAKKIVGDNGDYYELIETAWGYMLRYRDWDGLPYYYAANWKKLKTIYTLDKKYNVVTHYNPEAMIRAALYYDDGYYIEDADGNRFVTTDGRNWEEFSHRLPLVDVEFNNDEPSGWAADELTRAYEINAAPYDLKDKIDYDAPMTRTMFCYVLSTMLRRADMMPEDIDEDIEFTDTESNTIRKLATAGIISGYDDGSFRPEGEITRQEAAVLLYRAALSAYGNNVLEEYDKEMAEYFEEKGESTERALFATYDTYSDDKDINEWAYLPVYFLRDWNIMQGMTDGSFSPEMTYTNEQSIATILRLYDFINEYAKEKDR